ncbi:MAG TPA: VOC family protein [Chloroflexaceae bacterium]|nr:VOC family protein [Chloroflexaceae bacterium]
MSSFVIDERTAVGPVRLTVADLGRSLSFYEGVLGMRGARQPDGDYALSVGGPALLSLEERRGARPKPQRSTGLYHVAILMPTRADLARVIARLAEARYPLTGASDHLVSEALYLDDPDGNGLEIYADRPRAAWPKAGDEVRMTVDPLDIEAILGELDSASGPWAGLPAGTTIGHVHLHVADLRAAEEFYVGVLGFEVMQRFGNSALFVAAGGYHHHLGLNIWAGVGAPPPPADAVGLRHYAVRLPDQAALDAVLGRVRAAGLPVEEAGAGLFVRDPSQNVVLLALANDGIIGESEHAPAATAARR